MNDEELVEALARLQFADTKMPWDDVDPSAEYLRRRYRERAARAIVFIRAIDSVARQNELDSVRGKLGRFIELVDQGNDVGVYDVSGRWVALQLSAILDELDGVKT